MEAISVFDIFKIGVGPSSSHTMGPWRAAQKFLGVVQQRGALAHTVRIVTELFGSLAKTGHGHGTDIAVMLALSGDDPVTCDTATIDPRIDAIKEAKRIRLPGGQSSQPHSIDFDYDHDIIFHLHTPPLPFHANGIRFTAFLGGSGGGETISETYYSVGGGFVVQEGEHATGERAVTLPFHCNTGDDVLRHCRASGKTIPQIVFDNERVWRNEIDIRKGLLTIWRTMAECIYRGCHPPNNATLPGGLNVARRGGVMNRKLTQGFGSSGIREYDDLDGWLDVVRHSTREFQQILKWVSTFALAVNEENAAFGRVVTAPTNGAAGVIPAVMMYYWCFSPPGRSSEQGIIDFMLTSGEIGSLFKKGATISAAMGGCQAEIGVSSAMAAGGLTQVLGGTPGQVAMAAEIAMEHHLGMTCDPIAGLVQIPCIERNTMGAIKAITAANIALESDPDRARVSLDDVIKTMWETAQDMMGKYKETAEGGLAVNVSVSVSEC